MFNFATCNHAPPTPTLQIKLGQPNSLPSRLSQPVIIHMHVNQRLVPFDEEDEDVDVDDLQSVNNESRCGGTCQGLVYRRIVVG